jgi:hypothetical protein
MSERILGRGAELQQVGALLAHGYALRFRALTAGTAEVEWYRSERGAKPVLIASGRRTFTAAGTATTAVQLTAAGRKELLRAKRLALTAKGTFTPASAAPITAVRPFTLRR